MKVCEGKIGIDEKERLKILNLPVPTNIRRLRSFLGSINFFRKFIKGFSKKVVILEDKLKKGKHQIFRRRN